ncbi:MAG: SDR family oxidoreductase [Rhodospirillaceae bacterium]|nr:SDR family oxidoreductase [Rhodospirillaceae bacterium]
MKRLMAAAVLAAGLAASGAVQAATVLITGSNRGLGLEFAKQYAAQGWTVIATTRKPAEAKELNELAAKNKSVMVERLDVTDLDSIKALATKYKGKSVDVLINNAGILGDVPKQSFGNLDRDLFRQVMDTNVFGAFAVSEAFRENVAASEQKKIVALTSLLGSITTAGPGHTYYKASKAAMTMGLRVLGSESRKQGVIVGIIAPGVADTDMLKEFGYKGPLTVSATTAVEGMIKVIAGLTPEMVKKPINYDGKSFEW